MPHNSFKKLYDIAVTLRSPDGCPWDRKQTISSLEKCLVEELQEVREAIAKEDHANLKEELGDLLFLIVMMSHIAEEEGLFTMRSVLDDASQKLIDRHTWVFGDDKVSSAEEAKALWDKNKRLQKGK